MITHQQNLNSVKRVSRSMNIKNLHADLQSRVAGEFHADPTKVTRPELFTHADAIVQRVERDQEIQVARRRRW